ncbi:carboxypeptidase regulatory-like domain-containing protein [Rufibacter sp. XAAS-G3-1]|uniref:TonB-dependent receptor n=1 Tax=Rufibacter sp. XAAS-G3-1 TaxID=2729134 RepID=UPI0015E75A9F|nr:carboxypeptidase regulatory-like domain-containing protein [Rufibacter sp. XAAS-G3-1]
MKLSFRIACLTNKLSLYLCAVNPLTTYKMLSSYRDSAVSFLSSSVNNLNVNLTIALPAFLFTLFTFAQKKPFMKKFLLSTLLMLLCTAGLFAQVTTSSITGSVQDTKGEALIGATVKATHQPSGTIYGASTNTEGRFTIPSARIGGPYTIEVSYIGYQNQVFSNVSLKLGETYIVNSNLAESGTALQEVVVETDRMTVLNSARTGAATNVGTREIQTLPTISRSITDYTRLTPQGNANGNSFAGRDNRYNNIQVDGANLNNNFGLSSDPLPGGGAQPISIEAYDQISINIAPFDVRQANFTGAGINAVTKSGTNTFHGSAYTYYRNQDFLGSRVGTRDISSQIIDAKTNTYGFTLGGPIIKNKLFFFLNGEIEDGTRPGITWSPTGGSGSGNISRTTVEDLQAVSNYLQTKFGYNPGSYDNFPNFRSENKKLLVKLDWNITDAHRLTAKYSDLMAIEDVALNSTSVPNGGGFSVTGSTSGITRLPYGRFSNQSMAFENSNYFFENRVRTGTLELNSNFGGKMSNQLLGTISKITGPRKFNGPFFPSVDIFDGQGGNYISLGTDPYTLNNDVINDVYSITDNFSYYAGNHTITAGGTYEYQRVGNQFMAAAGGYYAFNSLDDFLNDRSPVFYTRTRSLTNDPAPYAADLKIGQLGFYLQDEINLSQGFKLTVGIRADKPIYLEKPLENTAVSALKFFDRYGDTTHYSTSTWPKSRWLFSPRVGFRWDVFDNNTLVVRGGTGIFTGRIPFVFLTNGPQNSGVIQYSPTVTDPATLSKIKLSNDPAAYDNLLPAAPGATIPSNLVFMDPEFKFPQVWRTNLAVEKTFGNGFNLTLEGLFTKELNGVRLRNANLKAPTGVILEGDNSRVRYFNNTNAERRLNPGIATALVLENAEKAGYSTSLTAQLSKTFSSGFYGMLAYTYTKATEVTANPGSTATSVYNSNPNVGTSNEEELGLSQYATPHRVIAAVSYRKEYLNRFASTLSFFYEGSTLGNYSFIVNGDLNADGNNATDLMYIPRNTSSAEINFEQYTSNGITFTPQQQAAAFEQFISNSPYLREHRGEYAERNAALRPWYNRLDMRFLQDFFITTGAKNVKHTLQFSVDVLNLPNLLNSEWGIQERVLTNNPLTFRSINANNQPVYRMQAINNRLVTTPFERTISTASTYSIQLGLRYNF